MREQEVVDTSQRWYHFGGEVVIAKIADAAKMSGLGKWTSVVNDERLHQIQSCETHSRRQPGKLKD